jgi:signal transduction histidine kinase
MFSGRFWIGATLFWLAFGLLAGIQVWVGMLSHNHFVPLLLGHHVLVWIVWAGFTAIIAWLVRRHALVPLSFRNIGVHLIAAFVIGATHIVYWIALELTMRPYDVRNASWGDISVLNQLYYRMPAELIVYFGVAGAMQAIDLYGRFRKREMEAAQLEASLTSARLHALELQIQPHFLFNTLNSVASLVRTGKNDQAVTMIAGLSDLLRYSLDHEGSSRVTVEAESQMLRRYLEIQRARFADRMTFSIDVDDAARRGMIPTLILQPLAENAVRHGIARVAAGGTVSVKAFRENGWLRVDITNTGSLSPSPEPSGLGLRNTRERLRQLYGEKHRFDLRQSADGVIASLGVPWSEEA